MKKRENWPSRNADQSIEMILMIAITYLTVSNKGTPALHLVSFELDQKRQEYTVTLKNNESTPIKISASHVSKNIDLIKGLSAEDANRIGYMAGVNDTMKEYNDP